MTIHVVRRNVQPHHWVGLFALILLAAAALIWSTRGAGYPNPADNSISTPGLAARSAAEREEAGARFSLICLDRLSRGKLHEALEYCDQALALDTNNLTALNLRGNALMLAGHPKAAIADFSRAIQLAPTDPSAYRFRANVAFALHRDADALADYTRAIAADPTSAASYEIRGQFFQMTGRHEIAIGDFDRAIALDPKMARAWNSRCWTKVLMNADAGAALADCDRALALDPRVANFHDSRGYALVRLAKWRDATAAFDRALALDPRLASSLFGRGLCKLRTGNRTAQADLARARSIEPGIEARFRGYGFRLKAGPAAS